MGSRIKFSQSYVYIVYIYILHIRSLYDDSHDSHVFWFSENHDIIKPAVFYHQKNFRLAVTQRQRLCASRLQQKEGLFGLAAQVNLCVDAVPRLWWKSSTFGQAFFEHVLVFLKSFI